MPVTRLITLTETAYINNNAAVVSFIPNGAASAGGTGGRVESRDRNGFGDRRFRVRCEEIFFDGITAGASRHIAIPGVRMARNNLVRRSINLFDVLNSVKLRYAKIARLLPDASCKYQNKKYYSYAPDNHVLKPHFSAVFTHVPAQLLP